MKTNTIRYSTIWCLLLTLFAVSSCKNDTGFEPVYDGINMRVSFTTAFAEPGGNSPSLNSKASIAGGTKNSVSQLETQTQIIRLSNGLNIVAKLVPEQQNSPVALKQSAGGLKAAATQVRTGLPIGTQYRLLVYDANGEEVKRIDKTVDVNGSSFEEFTLNATGEKTTYTFVAYSAGTLALPALAANSTLSGAMVTINNEKFMHFVETIDLGYGTNDLEVVLANKLTEITMILDGEGIGLNAITGVGNTVIKNATHSGGTIQLADGIINYSGTAQDKAVTFLGISPGGNTEVFSSPTALLHGSTTTANVNFDYIEIAGLGRSEPFVMADVKIEPGVKYNLVLELGKGNCMTNINPETFALSNTQQGCRIRLVLGIFRWYNYSIPQSECEGWFPLLWDRTWTTPNEGEVIGRTYEFASTANAGVVMNITKLDNSFNMAINDPAEDQNTANRKIATREIQFQGGGSPAHNIEFTDGSRHGNGASNIWEITNGTIDNPVVRVSISSVGVVSIEGRKSNDDLTLYPMRLYGSGNSFNTVDWNGSGNGSTNKVTITQTVRDITKIEGQVTGKRLAPCN